MAHLTSLMTAIVCGTVAGVACAETEEWGIGGMGRVYFESAYISSSGSLSYTEPVAEQYLAVKGRSPYGYLLVDMWLFSALNDQQHDKHRHAFSCYEGTLMYGYEVPVGETAKLDTNAGVLWDWLWGYEEDQHTPICWYVTQALSNRQLTPYWSALGGGIDAASDEWMRIRMGVKRAFRPVPSFKIEPFFEAVWADHNRYYRLYGDTPSESILGGALTTLLPGLVMQWDFAEQWNLWFRYRQYILVDGYARSLVADRGRETDKMDFPAFGVGIGCKF